MSNYGVSLNKNPEKSGETFNILLLEMNRPKLKKSISLKNFTDNYWLKADLISFCKEIGVNTTGGKIEISNRIFKYLESGVIITKTELNRKRIKSNFDWNNENLNLNTIITDNYKNTENVRAFFKREIGNNFKFNIEFMEWMRANSGKSLVDAVNRWTDITEKKKDKTYFTVIAPQFEYNIYLRDFLDNNPTLSTKEAIVC